MTKHSTDKSPENSGKTWVEKPTWSKVIRNLDSKGRTRGVQQRQPTTQARPTLTWIRSAPSSQRQGRPPICLSLSLGSQEANLQLRPRGKFPAAPTLPVAVIPRSRQSKALPCLGKGKDHQLRAASVTKPGCRQSCFPAPAASRWPQPHTTVWSLTSVWPRGWALCWSDSKRALFLATSIEGRNMSPFWAFPKEVLGSRFCMGHGGEI